ncbi:hypothetical protein FCIRC_4051 [Fusarium circinatum]|uniref:Uncharacterized protein n=1 Tax=Fusarium circinatum TaxID=48490 RepID=A0A8H5U7P5_FUSCI|nr:hypothetical protein FCIRC_4051 [Fusarium circinatum]
MDVPTQHQVHQSNDGPPGMSTINIISWTIGIMVALGFVIIFAKCLMGPRRPPPKTPRPPSQEPPSEGPLYPEPLYPLYPLYPVYPEPIGIAPPGPSPPGPSPPQAYDSDLEQGPINERADRNTKNSKVGNQTRVPPPPYCRRC